jgi:DNA polymerase-3 subunit delta
MTAKPASHTATDFLSKFAKATLLPVYCLVGEDAYQRDRILTAFRKRVLRKGSEDFDLSVYYGDECEIADVMDQLEMMPMLSERRLIIVKNADAFSAAEARRLVTYLANPAPQSVLVLAAEKIDKRQTFGKELSEKSVIVECKAPRSTVEVLEWLRRELAVAGMKVSPKALETFAQTVPLDYCTALTEWDKLLLYIGKTDSITLKDVQESLSQVRPVTVFDLQHAVGIRDAKTALDILSRFLSQSESMVFVVAMLNNFFQTVWRVSYLQSRKVPDREISAKHLADVYPARRVKIIDYARRYPLKELDRVFLALYETDYAIKSVDVPEPILGTILIQRICRGEK